MNVHDCARTLQDNAADNKVYAAASDPRCELRIKIVIVLPNTAEPFSGVVRNR
jgi:hypothetical protein